MSFRFAVDWMRNGLLNTMKQHRAKYCMKTSNAQSGSALCSIKNKETKHKYLHIPNELILTEKLTYVFR